jgi:hypothetical protein
MRALVPYNPTLSSVFVDPVSVFYRAPANGRTLVLSTFRTIHSLPRDTLVTPHSLPCDTLEHRTAYRVTS